MNVIQPLIDLQEVDGRVRELEREAKDIPARIEEEKSRMTGVNMALSKAKADLIEQQMLVKECIEERKELLEKIEKSKIQQATAKSNNEYMQLSIYISQLEQQVTESENRQKGIEDNDASFKSTVADAQARVDNDSVGVNAYVDELKERLAAVNEELAEVKKERDAVAANVNPRQKLVYERLGKKSWPVVVTLNADDVCDGCHLKQPPSIAQQVNAQTMGKLEDRIVTCMMCGRVLYRD